MKRLANTPHCIDCLGHPDQYMVRDQIWLYAMPDYAQIRAMRAERYPRGDWRRHVLLCFSCLEERLRRQLTLDDFDLSIPANSGIRLGARLQDQRSRGGW